MVLLSAAAHRGCVLSLAATILDGAPLLCSGGHDGAIRLWRQREGALLPAGALDPAGGSIFSVSAFEAGEGSVILAAGTFSRVLHTWRLGAGDGDEVRVEERLLSSREHTGWVRATAIADEHTCCSIGCNRLLAWRLPGGPPPAEPEMELALYDTDTAADKAAQRSHDILTIAWRGETLAAGSVDGAVRCWRGNGGPAALLSASAARPAHWLGHSDRVSAVCLAADGALLSAGYDGAVRAWGAPPADEEASGWRLRCEARVPRGRPLALAADGARVHCGTSAGEVFSLDADSLQLVAEPMQLSEGARATALAVLGSGTLVAGDSAGMLHLREFPGG